MNIQAFLECPYAACSNAECPYPECREAECRGTTEKQLQNKRKVLLSSLAQPTPDFENFLFVALHG